MTTSLLFTIALSIVGLGLLALYVAGALAKAKLKKNFPPKGKLIDVGGHHLHIQVEGQQHAGPTVVLESGAGGVGAQWALVQTAVAQFARVVAYDRAGYGWSDPFPPASPRTAEVLAAELYTLLNKAGVPAPYILVGHSLGGVVVRYFAQHHPELVAGLVLVDSAHEQQYQRFPAELVKMLNSMKAMFGVMRLLNQFGIQALNPKMIAGDDSGPRALVDVYRALVATNPNHFVATQAESEAALQGYAAPEPLGNVPLIVLSHGIPQDVPMAKPEVNAAYEQAWQTMQTELAALSTESQHQIVEAAGHNIQIDKPEVVIEAIRNLWETTSTPIVVAGMSYADR